MAGYPKIWTCITDESWYVRLSGHGRSFILQLIVLAKKCSDNGHLEFKSYQDLAHQVAISRNTCVRIASDLTQVGVIELTKGDSGELSIFLPKYIVWQEMTAKDVASYLRNSDSNLKPKSRQADQTKPNQSKAEQSNIPFVEIITDLNQQANKKYPTNPVSIKTKGFIKARWNDGYKLDDFKYVNKVKVADMKRGEFEDKYLRPETLYGNKFEGYRQQSAKTDDRCSLGGGHREPGPIVS